MEMIKEILIDSFNGFSVKMIPLFLFQILISGLLAYAFQWLFKRKTGYFLHEGVILAMSVSLIASIVKYSLPFSVLGAALILVHNSKSNRSSSEFLHLLILGIIGVGCGVGSVVQTAFGLVILCVILIFTPLKKSDEIKS